MLARGVIDFAVDLDTPLPPFVVAQTNGMVGVPAPSGSYEPGPVTEIRTGVDPNGAAPVVRGEAVNTGTTYGYDSVTMMQETKTTICNLEKA